MGGFTFQVVINGWDWTGIHPKDALVRELEEVIATLKQQPNLMMPKKPFELPPLNPNVDRDPSP